MADIIEKARHGDTLNDAEALALAALPLSAELLNAASAVRDAGFGDVVTFSKKVFIPLTQLCRDVCHYCTFAKAPRELDGAYMPLERVLEIARQGAALGCKEALFTLGEKPEARYSVARRELEAMGFASTIDYVAHAARQVLEQTGLLPHINAGNLDAAEFAALRRVSASMGIMLESAAERLCEKGAPHYGSPDKLPTVRLATIDLAGRARVPFTSGILIGIGETRRERIDSLLALRHSHQRHGQLQELIIQNFRAKAGTRMANAPEPDLAELQWTIAVARLIFGSAMSVQAPPNLNTGELAGLIAAGVNDWGGVSPLTPDHVNPEAPWPHLQTLAEQTRAAGKVLDERLTIYPAYARQPMMWLDEAVRPAVLRLQDGAGFARGDSWSTGDDTAPPVFIGGGTVSPAVRDTVRRAQAGERLAAAALARLFEARGAEYEFICEQADRLRRERCGDDVTYVVNRNINYTNICGYKCTFCAFSKGRGHDDLRGRPYLLDNHEIQNRVREAWARGATEVCLQGGIHPDYTGQTYLDIVHAVREAEPRMHIHAFSPLEVSHGAATLGIGVDQFLERLRNAGLNTLPGTAAEILDDGVRALLCPDKLNVAQWLAVMEAAHGNGLRTTATIMFGHVDGYAHWAGHLLSLRDLQTRTGGFTEFVPLPFVAREAPLYRRGHARRGPTFRESVLMHAVARLALHPLIPNIQTSWVKMGPHGAARCLQAGANDLGGTLMNESITRAAGATHGEEFAPWRMSEVIHAIGRTPRQRTTLYQIPPREQVDASFRAADLLPIGNTPVVAPAKTVQLLARA